MREARIEQVGENRLVLLSGLNPRAYYFGQLALIIYDDRLSKEVLVEILHDGSWVYLEDGITVTVVE